jgi:hypothetical protein
VVMKWKTVWAELALDNMSHSPETDDLIRKAFLKGFEEAKRMAAEHLRNAVDRYQGKDFRQANQLCEDMRHIVLHIGEEEVNYDKDIQ